MERLDRIETRIMLSSELTSLAGVMMDDPTTAKCRLACSMGKLSGATGVRRR